MSYQVIAVLRDDGDFVPLFAVMNNWDLPVADWMQESKDFISYHMPEVEAFEIELKNVEPVMSGELLNG